MIKNNRKFKLLKLFLAFVFVLSVSFTAPRAVFADENLAALQKTYDDAKAAYEAIQSKIQDLDQGIAAKKALAASLTDEEMIDAANSDIMEYQGLRNTEIENLGTAETALKNAEAALNDAKNAATPTPSPTPKPTPSQTPSSTPTASPSELENNSPTPSETEVPSEIASAPAPSPTQINSPKPSASAAAPSQTPSASTSPENQTGEDVDKKGGLGLVQILIIIIGAVLILFVAGLLAINVYREYFNRKMIRERAMRRSAKAGTSELKAKRSDRSDRMSIDSERIKEPEPTRKRPAPKPAAARSFSASPKRLSDLEHTVMEHKPSSPDKNEHYDHKLETAHSAHIGKRENQQDSLYVTGTSQGMKYEEIFAMGVLCDGMGGMSGGEQASALAVELFNQHLLEAGTIENMPSYLTDEMKKIDRAVYNLSEELGVKGGMGTTLVSVIVINSHLYWASVGDSRIYILRGDEMLQVTRDHNYMFTLAEKVKRGEITEEAALSNPQREALISYMGMGGIDLIDINKNPFKLVDEDIVLLSSDGLFKTLSDEEILGIIRLYENDLNKAAEALVDSAIGKGREHQDNTSVILIKYHKK